MFAMLIREGLGARGPAQQDAATARREGGRAGGREGGRWDVGPLLHTKKIPFTPCRRVYRFVFRL